VRVELVEFGAEKRGRESSWMVGSCEIPSGDIHRIVRMRGRCREDAVWRKREKRFGRRGRGLEGGENVGERGGLFRAMEMT
jgi:hypothetical protein